MTTADAGAAQTASGVPMRDDPMTVEAHSFDRMLLGLVLPGTRQAVPIARHVVRLALGPEHPAADDIELLISELISNAVLHTRSGQDGHVTITLLHANGARLIRAVVLDQGGTDTAPHIPHGAPLAENGHGLLLVATIAKRHGTHPANGGRTVWFEVTY